MADSFINKLDESKTVKSSDFTAFDIADSGTGKFYTKKVAYSTLVNKISSDVVSVVQSQIDILQQNLNTTNTNSQTKLDKRGTNFDPNEKMTGPLVLNSTLTVNGTSDFYNTVNLHNNKIVSLATPTSNYDAATKKYVDDVFGSITIPNTSNYLLKTGDVMTGGYLTLANSPTNDSHAATKKYVDDKVGTFPNVTGYLPLSGGTMTGNVNLNNKVISNVPTPVANSDAVNKKYVDDKLISSSYLPLAGGTMTGNIDLNSKVISNVPIPTLSGDASNKGYVDGKLANIQLSSYLPLSGGTMTGSLILKGFSEKVGTSTVNTNIYTFDLSSGNTFNITMNSNITRFQTSNAPSDSYSITLALTQGTGAYTVTTWSIDSINIKWSDGIPPTITNTNGKTDIFGFTKIGSIWYGFIGGQNF